MIYRCPETRIHPPSLAIMTLRAGDIPLSRYGEPHCASRGRARSPSAPQSPANHRQPTSALQGATTRMLAPPSGSASPNLPSEAELLRRMGAPLRWNAASRRRAAWKAAFPVRAYAHANYRRETLSGKAAVSAAVSRADVAAAARRRCNGGDAVAASGQRINRRGSLTCRPAGDMLKGGVW